jgi:hypothetical protein
MKQLMLKYSPNRSAMEQREKHHKKPVGTGTKSDVVYNVDGRGAPKVSEPAKRFRFEPFKSGTDR